MANDDEQQIAEFLATAGATRVATRGRHHFTKFELERYERKRHKAHQRHLRRERAKKQ